MSSGRPVERPAHISAEQRQEAQRQTAAWRQLARLSQKQMAARVLVGHSTYRMWESGREAYSGPTRAQALQLDGALVQLLGPRYQQGRAIEIWGWNDAHKATYAEVAAILRPAGFIVPNSQASPALMVWMHRLREPNIIHGVFALAAAAATRAGLSVRLLLDDVTLPSAQRRDLRAEFESRVRGWFSFAGGDDSKLSISLYSAILTQEFLAEHGWRTVDNYLHSSGPVLDFLLASKIVSPLQYTTDAEQSILELVQQAGESLQAARLLMPFRNWMIFDAELTRLLDAEQTRLLDGAITVLATEAVVTLGAEDERHMWELWHRGNAVEVSERVHHIYLRPAPLPSYRVPWQEPALAARTSRSWLTAYLRKRTAYDGNTDLLEWFARAAVALPAALSPGYRENVDPALLSPGPLDRRSAEETAAAIAAAVVSWLGGD